MSESDTGTGPTIGRFEKRATDARHAARIVHEAEVLAAAQGPGVVALIGLEGDGAEPVLVTRRIDGPDLARTPPLPLPEAAAVVAAVAKTLADLHALGVVHGAVVPEHVLLGRDGRPVLCGFSHGGRTGEPPLAEAVVPDASADPARRPGDPLSPASDVLALGAMLRDLVAASEPAGPARIVADALRAVADRTAARQSELRPSAGALAAAVSHAAPAARLPRQAEADGVSPPTWSPSPRRPAARASDPLRAWRHRGAGGRLPGNHRRRRGLVAVPIVALTAVAAVVVAGHGRARAPSRVAPVAGLPGAATVATEPAPATTAAPPPTTAVAAPPGRSCPSIPALLAADTDGDGCPEPLRWADGVVEAADRRWSVGQPGDVAATGDWSCTGRPSLAVLRPSTGQVFVFDGWAGPGHDVNGPLAARVEGGFALRAAADLGGDGCPDLLVERAGGPPATVPVPAGGR